MRRPRKKGILRFDRERYPSSRTTGWWVRVYYKGRIVSRFFSDSLHGGKRAGLHAARAWRDKTERLLRKPQSDRTVVLQSARGPGVTIGIRRTFKQSDRKGLRFSPVFEVYAAPQPNKIWRTSVSINKYGLRKARRRALSIRRRMQREIFARG